MGRGSSKGSGPTGNKNIIYTDRSKGNKPDKEGRMLLKEIEKHKVINWNVDISQNGTVNIKSSGRGSGVMSAETATPAHGFSDYSISSAYVGEVDWHHNQGYLSRRKTYKKGTHEKAVNFVVNRIKKEMEGNG